MSGVDWSTRRGASNAGRAAPDGTLDAATKARIVQQLKEEFLRITKDTIERTPTAHDVLYMRCMAHRMVPQLNAEGGDGEECAGCIAEDVVHARAHAGRLYNVVATMVNLIDDIPRAVDLATLSDLHLKLRKATADARGLVTELQPMFFVPMPSQLLDASGRKVE